MSKETDPRGGQADEMTRREALKRYAWFAAGASAVVLTADEALAQANAYIPSGILNGGGNGGGLAGTGVGPNCLQAQSWRCR